MLRPTVKIEQQIDLGGGLWLLPTNGNQQSEPFRAPVKIGFTYHLRFADVAYKVVPGLVTDAVEMLGLDRIAGVFNLQFLTPYRVSNGAYKDLPKSHGFGHDRLSHSLNSAVLNAAMLKREGLNGIDLKVSILAEIVHDAMTCAGGDAMMVLDPEYFNEDQMIGRLFAEHASGWTELQRRHKLPDTTVERVQEIVDGRGWQGQLHDITDTCSYLALDSQELAAAYSNGHARHLDGEKVHDYFKADHHRFFLIIPSTKTTAPDSHQGLITLPWTP